MLLSQQRGLRESSRSLMRKGGIRGKFLNQPVCSDSDQSPHRGSMQEAGSVGGIRARTDSGPQRPLYSLGRGSRQWGAGAKAGPYWGVGSTSGMRDNDCGDHSCPQAAREVGTSKGAAGKG